MKAAWLVAALGVLTLAACGDGSIKSPDFEPVTKTTLDSVEIKPATPATIPAGTTVSYRAVAHYTMTSTVPPGTNDSGTVTQTREEDITDQATWTSSAPGVATVDKGVVTGKAPNASPVTITASFEDESPTVQVTVTAAVLQRVSYIKPVGTARNDEDNYTALVGNSVSFEMYGVFSDDTTPRRLDPSAYTITWTSGDPAVAANTAPGSNSFRALQTGDAEITGQVQGTAASPSSAAANLEVGAASAFCEREFVTPAAKVSTTASALCLGCSVTDPELAADGDIDTEAVMNIPLALLLGADVSLIVSDPSTPLVANKPVGFFLSRDASILEAELLSTITITTVKCDADGANCEDVESFGQGTDALHLGLLGLIGSEAQYKAVTDPITNADANGIKLTFNGGLIGLLATLNVQGACAAALP